MFKKLWFFILPLTLLGCSAALVPLPAYADMEIPVEAKKEKLGTFESILILEGVFLVNSWLASGNPHAYGAGTALVAPIGLGAGKSSSITNWVMFIGIESIAGYNLTIDENNETKSDIFKKNMIGWHLFIGAVGLSSYLIGDYDNDKSISLMPTPKGGAQLVFNYKF